MVTGGDTFPVICVQPGVWPKPVDAVAEFMGPGALSSRGMGTRNASTVAVALVSHASSWILVTVAPSGSKSAAWKTQTNTPEQNRDLLTFLPAAALSVAE